MDGGFKEICLNDVAGSQLFPAVPLQNKVLIWQWLLTQREYLGIQEIQNLIAVKSDLSGPNSLCKSKGTIWPLTSGVVESDGTGFKSMWLPGNCLKAKFFVFFSSIFWHPRIIIFSLSLVHPQIPFNIALQQN